MAKFQFVFDSDEVPKWNAVEDFKNVLTALLLKHKLRLDSEGFKNEKALREYIERYWARRDKGAENQQVNEQPELATYGEGNIEALDKTYRELFSDYQERIRVRAERAIRRLIRTEYQHRVRAEYPALHGVSFPNIGARNRAAETRSGIYRDEAPAAY